LGGAPSPRNHQTLGKTHKNKINQTKPKKLRKNKKQFLGTIGGCPQPQKPKTLQTNPKKQKRTNKKQKKLGNIKKICF
jgi:hypothetical protein